MQGLEKIKAAVGGAMYKIDCSGKDKVPIRTIKKFKAKFNNMPMFSFNIIILMECVRTNKPIIDA